MLRKEPSGCRAQGCVALHALELGAREPLSVEGYGKETTALRAVRSQQVEYHLTPDAHTSKVLRNLVEFVLRRGRAGRNHDCRELLGR
jgi:hypothetical protein